MKREKRGGWRVFGDRKVGKGVLAAALVALVATVVGTTEVRALSSFRFDFREAVIRDDNYQHMIGKYWNEIYDFSYGQFFWNELVGLNVGFGFLMESGRKRGAETDRVSEESMSVLMLRPSATVMLQYTRFGVRPFIEGGWGVYYFQDDEKGTYPRSVDGWQHGPLVRGGLNFSMKSLFYSKSAFPTAEELDLKDIVFSLNAGCEFLNVFNDHALNLSSYYASLGVQLNY